jgi:hypothetical protein
MRCLPPEILRMIIAICFSRPDQSRTGSLSNSLQLSTQMLRAITLEIVWRAVELDGPGDALRNLLCKDHIRHVVRVILIRNMQRAWPMTSWRMLISLLQSFTKLRKVFFEQDGTGVYDIEHLSKINPTKDQNGQHSWDVLTFYEIQRDHRVESSFVPWGILERLLCSSLIARIQFLDVTSNHGVLETDLMTYCVLHGIVFSHLRSLTLGGLTERTIAGELIWRFINVHIPSILLLKVTLVSQPSPQPHGLVELWAKCTWPPTLRHLQFPADCMNGDWPPSLLSYANVYPRNEPSYRPDILCQQMHLEALQELYWCTVDAYEVLALLDTISYESPHIRRIELQHPVPDLDESSVSLIMQRS